MPFCPVFSHQFLTLCSSGADQRQTQALRYLPYVFLLSCSLLPLETRPLREPVSSFPYVTHAWNWLPSFTKPFQQFFLFLPSSRELKSFFVLTCSVSMFPLIPSSLALQVYALYVFFSWLWAQLEQKWSIVAPVCPSW